MKKKMRRADTSSIRYQNVGNINNTMCNVQCGMCNRVLHGPGLGPRARPACSPWAGPGFNDILRAGPGAGLTLAGPGPGW